MVERSHIFNHEICTTTLSLSQNIVGKEDIVFSLVQNLG